MVCAHQREDGEAPANRLAPAAKPAVPEEGVPPAAVRGEGETLA